LEVCLKKLTTEAFARAASFMTTLARPLERARFEHDFQQLPAEAVLAALAAFRNDDGGFGQALEPDLWMPASSVLCTAEALHVLYELGVSPGHPFVIGAVDWLVAAFDPELGAWRQVSQEAEAYPHAAHWRWELHADGKRWPVGVLPRAEVLSHLWRNSARVPTELLEDQTRRLVSDFASCDALGGDSVGRCEMFVRTTEAPSEARAAIAARMVEAGSEIVTLDRTAWNRYCAKPLTLAPDPACVLAAPLARDVERNLDWEIEQQAEDGSWAPNWTWGGAFPSAWTQAERWWRGPLTLQALRSLRAYGRIEGL